MKFLYLLVSFFLLVSNVQAISINEFMPNPDDSCNDCSEWIELTSHEKISLENITLDTGEHPLTLNGSLQADEFIIITKNSTRFLQLWNSSVIIFENKKMSLRNSGDNITLYSGSDILQKVEYNKYENNISYGICDSFFVEQNVSTPGLMNNCFSNETNETYENETNTTDTCDLRVWIECNITFGLKSNNYYPMTEDILGGKFQPEVEYWIEDLFGNIARSKFRTNNTNTAKSWTPSKIKGTEAYLIHAEIANNVCNDTNLSNNKAEKMIVVRGEEPYSECSCKEKIIEVETPCSCGACPKCICEEEEEESPKENFEIVSNPEEAINDEEIEIKIRIYNPSGQEKNYIVYSYVYENNKPLSLGFDGKNWVNTWDANKKNIKIPSNSSLNITLINRIANDTELGKYILKVRIKFDDKTHDMTDHITIKEAEEKTKEEVKNETIPEEEKETIKIPTGRTISRNNYNLFEEFAEKVINFFKELFRI